MIQLLHRWIWHDAERRARKLLTFAKTEADGGRDLLRAAGLTQDPTLRRLYMIHAADEQRHAELFRWRGTALLRSLPKRSSPVLQLNWVSPGERGLDDLCVERESDATLLAFLHLSEKAATSHFAVYRNALHDDQPTKAVLGEILRDEKFHMNYTLSQLTRIAPERRPMLLWRARLTRLWKFYLRAMSALAGVIGTLVLTFQYFILLPPFAILAKRAERREPPGWTPISTKHGDSLESQY
jgi:rubrerythrin